MPFSFKSDKENLTPLKNDDGTFALAENNNIELWKVSSNLIYIGNSNLN